MSSAVVFLVLLVLTVAALGAAVAAGLLGKRELHIPLVVTTVVLLSITIWRALVLGEAYDLAATGAIYPAHITIARGTVVALLAPAITGVLTMLRANRKALHRRLAWAALVLTVATATTGASMMFLAQPV